MTANPSQFESAVLETVVFFDLFDYPLTSFELWQNSPPHQKFWCGGAPSLKISFEQFAAALDGNKFLDQQSGFYLLKGQEKILDERQKNYREALQKAKIAKRFIKYLRLIPFIRGVALCNSLGYFNARPTDDIDLFILVKPRRLWLTRGLAVLLAELLAARPSSGKTRNAVCLSFFAAEDADLSSLRLQPEDPYFDWWMTKLLPLYDADNVWQKFFANNNWIYDQHPNFFPVQPARRLGIYFQAHPMRHFVISNKVRNLINKQLMIGVRFLGKLGMTLFGWSGDSMEKIAKAVQWKLMTVKIKELANKDTRVVLNDEVFKFHVNDRREWYREEWRKKLEILVGCG